MKQLLLLQSINYNLIIAALSIMMTILKKLCMGILDIEQKMMQLL